MSAKTRNSLPGAPTIRLSLIAGRQLDYVGYWKVTIQVLPVMLL